MSEYDIPTTNTPDRPIPIPDSIKYAIKVLNNPWDYGFLHHEIPPGVRGGPYNPTGRINAKAEWCPLSGKWVLYVEWDDSEPLYPRSIVNAVVSHCGLTTYVASGTSAEKDFTGDWKFPAICNPEVPFLKVEPSERSMNYVCEECQQEVGRHNMNVDFSINVG